MAITAAGAGCGGAAQTIPGTEVVDSEDNRVIIETIETYRLAVERKDAPALVMMASKDYWEESGTPSGDDDYGYDGLERVFLGRFQQSDGIRYSVRYVNIKRSGKRAFVDIIVHASWTIQDARGEEMRKKKRDQNQLVLEWDGEAWKFLSGM